VSQNTVFVFAIVYASYFMVTSGIIYDLIIEPPSIGSTRDPSTGAYKPEAFMKYRINGQYIIEGLAAGMLFCLGGLGVIILDKSDSKFTSDRNRFLMISSGIVFVGLAFNLCNLFLRIKFPGYQS